MNQDMMTAAQLLFSGNYTCVMCRSGVCFTSEERGIKPLLNWLDSGTDFSGFFAADQIVGSAAAFLYIHLRIRGVYAKTMTIRARDILFANGIAVQCDNYVETIINRQGTGPCPFESAVENTFDPIEALPKIYKAYEML